MCNKVAGPSRRRKRNPHEHVRGWRNTPCRPIVPVRMAHQRRTFEVFSPLPLRYLNLDLIQLFQHVGLQFRLPGWIYPVLQSSSWLIFGSCPSFFPCISRHKAGHPTVFAAPPITEHRDATRPSSDCVSAFLGCPPPRTRSDICRRVFFVCFNMWRISGPPIYCSPSSPYTQQCAPLYQLQLASSPLE